MLSTSEPSDAPTAASAGTTFFYDGRTARRRPVVVDIGHEGLVVREADAVLSEWPYGSIRRHHGPADVMRLHRVASPDPERLEIYDEALKEAIVRRCARLDEGTRLSRRTLARIVGASLAAAVSLILTVTYLVPLAADRLVPFVPLSFERRIGDAVDGQLRTVFQGSECVEPAGLAALARLSGRLAAPAALPFAPQTAILSSPVPNAFALPGGRILLLEGLLRRAESADEIAGVIAHEMGHVAHRDGLRAVMRTGGSSALLGLLFGDVTGAGTVVLLGRMLVDTSHSRQAEAAADAFAAQLMHALGRPAKPMGAFLVRLTGTGGTMPLPFLATHPLDADRLAALAAGDPPETAPPLLTDEEWRSLKAICKRG